MARKSRAKMVRFNVDINCTLEITKREWNRLLSEGQYDSIYEEAKWEALDVLAGSIEDEVSSLDNYYGDFWMCSVDVKEITEAPTKRRTK